MTLAQFLCGLRGHDRLLKFENYRMSLECTQCGHETPGITIKEVQRELAQMDAARRHHLDGTETNARASGGFAARLARAFQSDPHNFNAHT